SVTFTPSATGARAGTIAITHSAPNSPQTVSLSGTAVIPTTITPTSLIFPAMTPGATSAAISVALKNNASTAISIASIAPAGDFAQTNTCGASLAGGATCTISVTFTPSASGARTGTIAITDSAPNSP